LPRSGSAIIAVEETIAADGPIANKDQRDETLQDRRCRGAAFLGKDMVDGPVQ
jgi:hypothetical protein